MPGDEDRDEARASASVGRTLDHLTADLNALFMKLAAEVEADRAEYEAARVTREADRAAYEAARATRDAAYEVSR